MPARPTTWSEIAWIGIFVVLLVWLIHTWQMEDLIETLTEILVEIKRLVEVLERIADAVENEVEIARRENGNEEG